MRSGTKASREKSRIETAICAAVLMVAGAGFAWGPGGAMFGLGLFLLAITICEELTDK